MYLHICPACEQGQHDICWGTKKPPPGVYGGSSCTCGCQDKPDEHQLQAEDFKWNNPDENEPTPAPTEHEN